MTKLDAVNEILAAIGEDPVNSLDSGLPDADRAEQALDRVVRQALTRGWWFNVEEGYTFYPNVDDKIELPAEVASVTGDQKDAGRMFTIRNGFLYDMDEHTDEFSKEVSVRVTWELPWTDLPSVFRDYATIKAARHFQDNQLGSQKHHQYYTQDEAQAYALLVEQDVIQDPANMNRDSYSALDITGRFHNPSKYIP